MQNHLLLLFTSLLLLSSTTTAYLGPTPCSNKSSSVGYSTFNHLLFDLTSLTTTYRTGSSPLHPSQLLFTLCPNTILDLDETTTLPLGYIPISIPHITIQCGDNGSRSNNCIIRGGGKYTPSNPNWNKSSQSKEGLEGIVGGGVSQIYVYGRDAYEVTLRGLTFDNALNEGEESMGGQFVNVFGSVQEDESGSGEDVQEELLSGDGGRRGVLQEGMNDTSHSMQDTSQQQQQQQPPPHRKLQTTISPAYRFAAVAVRGNGYGDDAGARIITIDDCKFQWHRGYAILVSPGIREPDIPVVPSSAYGIGVDADDLTVSNVVNNNNMGDATTTFEKGNARKLNLLDNGANFIPSNGKVSYYDTTPTTSTNYLDKNRRVKITKTEFVNNTAAVNNVAGLVTSAYSLTMTDCFFQSNEAKAMVFAYNNDALVKNTMFTENKVEVATVVLASPVGSSSEQSSSSSSSSPTHIMEQTCFLGSNVGMSNVLVTDVETTGFGQRQNHAAGTEFSWVSECEGAAAEKYGHECLDGGKCDGTCVGFEEERCLVDLTRLQMSSGVGRRDGWRVQTVFAAGCAVVLSWLLL